MDRKKCCFVGNYLEECENEAVYRIWSGWWPTPYDYTESCDEHLAEILDDNERFEIIRIEASSQLTQSVTKMRELGKFSILQAGKA